MPISHICLNCGVDLARVRSTPHPTLAINAVVCPECGVAAVRRKHPLIRDSRRFLRARRAIWTLVGQFTLLAGFLTFAAAIAHATARWTYDEQVSLRALALAAVAAEPSGSRRVDSEAPYVLIFFAVASVAAGIWLGIGLPHWRVITRPPAYAAALALAALTPVLAWAFFVVPVHAIAGRTYHYTGPTASGWLTVAAVLLASFVISTLTLPIGIGMQRMLDAHRRSRRRRAISKTRIARSGG